MTEKDKTLTMISLQYHGRWLAKIHSETPPISVSVDTVCDVTALLINRQSTAPLPDSGLDCVTCFG